jgi:hypothetical protein
VQVGPLNIVLLVVAFSCDAMEERWSKGPRAAQLKLYQQQTAKLIPYVW